MRTIVFYVLFLSSLIAIPILLSSCKEDCEPQYYSSTVPDNQKEYIPSKVNDTLNFTDELGQRYFLICTTKKSLWNGGSNIGSLNNPCEESSHSWEYIRANFSGNLLSDNKDNIEFSTFIGDTNYDPNHAPWPCNSNTRYKLILKFGAGAPVKGYIPAQFVDGFTDDNASVAINNFTFKPKISLNGKDFQNVNSFSVMTPGSASTCIPKKISEVGIDSVYYTKQFGLIRFTTVGGKKYQRVL